MRLNQNKHRLLSNLLIFLNGGTDAAGRRFTARCFGTVARQRPGGPMGSRALWRKPQSAGGAAHVERAVGPAVGPGPALGGGGALRGFPRPHGPRTRPRPPGRCHCARSGDPWGAGSRPPRPGEARSCPAEPSRPPGCGRPVLVPQRPAAATEKG